MNEILYFTLVKNYTVKKPDMAKKAWDKRTNLYKPIKLRIQVNKIIKVHKKNLKTIKIITCHKMKGITKHSCIKTIP